MMLRLFSPLLRWALLVGMALSIGLLFRQNRRLSSDVARCNRNLEAATEGLQAIALQDGRSAAQSGALQMKLSEVAQSLPGVIAEVKRMGVKPARTEEVSTTGYLAQNNITTVLRDSIVADTAHYKIFRYADPWYQVSGIAGGDSQQVSIRSEDTLTQVIYRGKRAEWWNPFSSRPLMQRCAFSNPAAHISYQQTVQISRHP